MKKICIPIDMRAATRIKSAGGVITAASEKTEMQSIPLPH